VRELVLRAARQVALGELPRDHEETTARDEGRGSVDDGSAFLPLVEHGFDYSSNFFDDDSPYLLEVEGKPTQIVELPFRWVLDDAPFFQYSIVLPGRTMQAPSAVLEAWKAEFDVLYAERRMMMVGMHPEMIGQPSRLKVLEGLIEHALAHPDVWIGRCDEMSDALRPRLAAAGA